MNSSNLLARNARKYPNTEAVVSLGVRTSYKELHVAVNKFADSLINLGITSGDKVVIFMPNVLEFVISYFAIQRIGAIVVPINAKFTQPEIEYIMEHADAKGIITHALIHGAAANIQLGDVKITTGEAGGAWHNFNQLLEVGRDEEISCNLHEDDLSTILYTSGTTGDPKGVLFTYRNILAVATMIAIEMEVKPESRLLLMMPLSHSAPLHLFLMAGVMVGATNVLTPTFTPQLLLETVSTEKTTHFFGAPVAYLLTASMPTISDYDLSSMQWWVYGGAPLSQKEVLMISDKFKTDRLVCVYGLTEAGPSGSILLADQHPQLAGSIGTRAPFGTELRIVDDNGEDVAVGEIGEIVLFGEGNMRGYYKNDEATAATFINGWLKTGDLARFDEDGAVWIVDRKKDVIISGGVNVYPKEIEDLILQFEGVTEVAVVGVPHLQWGETVKAIFAAKELVNEEQLVNFLRKSLADFKVPKLFEQVDVLPRNASGKILKQQLRKVEVE